MMHDGNNPGKQTTNIQANDRIIFIQARCSDLIYELIGARTAITYYNGHRHGKIVMNQVMGMYVVVSGWIEWLVVRVLFVQLVYSCISGIYIVAA